jgi:hypothetical protein
VNEGKGSNVTTPVVVFNVYVPSPGTVTDVCEQLFGVSAAIGGVTVLSARPHSLMVDTCNGNDEEPGASPSSGDNV